MSLYVCLTISGYSVAFIRVYSPVINTSYVHLYTVALTKQSFYINTGWYEIATSTYFELLQCFLIVLNVIEYARCKPGEKYEGDLNDKIKQ